MSTTLTGAGRLTDEEKPAYHPRSIVFRERSDGWVGSGFDRKVETLAVECVTPTNSPACEVRIALDIDQFYDKAGRSTRRNMSGTVTLNAGQFLELVAHAFKDMDPVVQRCFMDNLPLVAADMAGPRYILVADDSDTGATVYGKLWVHGAEYAFIKGTKRHNATKLTKHEAERELNKIAGRFAGKNECWIKNWRMEAA